MTFLELCNRLHAEVKDSGVGLASVENQKGSLLDIVNATREAWVQIQTQRPWDAEFWGSKGDGTYYSQFDPQVLSANFDTPFLPAIYHTLIVYEAMKSLAIKRSATELLVRANDGYDSLLIQVTNRYSGAQFGVPQQPEDD